MFGTETGEGLSKLQAERKSKGNIKHRRASRDEVPTSLLRSFQPTMWRKAFMSPHVLAFSCSSVLNYSLYPRHAWRMLWLTKVDQPGFMWCFALLYCQIKQMTGDVNVNIEAPGGGKYWGKTACRRKKKEMWGFVRFFFFGSRDNKIYLLDRNILSTLVALTAVNISGLLLLSGYFSHWSVAAKCFLGAILSVLQVSHEKYPWNDWNRFYWWKHCTLPHGKYRAEWRMPSPKKLSQGGECSGKFLVDLYSLRWTFIQHSVGRDACGWCLACECKLSLWVNQASSWARWGINETFG